MTILINDIATSGIGKEDVLKMAIDNKYQPAIAYWNTQLQYITGDTVSNITYGMGILPDSNYKTFKIGICKIIIGKISFLSYRKNIKI